MIEEFLKRKRNINNNKPIDYDQLKKKTKIALCAIAKDENLYIREWIKWYEGVGVSKIFLYDNNETDGERFEDVINDYIKSGFVEIIDVRGKEKGCVYDEQGINLQTSCYIDCYENRVSEFNWVCFFDIDEFLDFKNKNNIFTFLNNPRFKNTNTILIPWLHFSDNGLARYENKDVVKRFTKESYIGRHGVKSIVRCGKKINNKKQSNLIHIFTLKGNLTSFANFTKVIYDRTWYILGEDDFQRCVCYLRHYKTKSAEEYLKRHLGRHWGTSRKHTNNAKTLKYCIEEYYKYNECCDATLKYFESFEKELNN